MTEFFNLTIDNKNFDIVMVNANFDFTLLKLPLEKSVNILASGASIKQIDFTILSQQPCMFVNGSIELTRLHHFMRPIGYVITDPRFIRHNLVILQNCYQAQCPLFITQSVLVELAVQCPDFLSKFSPTIYLIFAVDKPIVFAKKQGILGKIFTKKLKLGDFQHSLHYIIKNDIGVSLDIRHGFVEAGTVAYVATQVAFSMGFQQIDLYGIDLINANEPRFYENKQNAAPNKLAPAIYNRIIPSFDLLAKTYAEQGVKVINHSPISKDLFQFLPFH